MSYYITEKESGQITDGPYDSNAEAALQKKAYDFYYCLDDVERYEIKTVDEITAKDITEYIDRLLARSRQKIRAPFYPPPPSKEEAIRRFDELNFDRIEEKQKRKIDIWNTIKWPVAVFALIFLLYVMIFVR